MINKINKLWTVFLILIFLLFIIPSIYAHDNLTLNQVSDSYIEITNYSYQSSVESSSNDNSNVLSVDYYFNSSLEVDGDGSINSPYNNINDNRFKSGSTIHLANGEYILNSNKRVNGITIIGENPEKTILKYGGSYISGNFSVGVDNSFILKNVTLIGFNIDVKGATIKATNTYFKNTVAFPTYSHATNLVNSASNSFGGAIYAHYYKTYYHTYLPKVILDNCTFINNTGEYGGAIFMNKGELTVINSLFINNSAYNYGGAIASVYDVVLNIKGCKFINDTSLNDAGGAIYLLQSKLTLSNVSVFNCSATFGAAITSLNSTTSLVNFNAVNNIAKYNGGAIYQFYNNILISNSTFINNSAFNGGAIYVNSLKTFNISYNNFINNSAFNGGAIYSLLNPNKPINNKFYNNNAKINNDSYETNDIILFIGNKNYTIYFNNITFDGKLPISYDLREKGFVTPVKDQQSGGNCWAFASLSALESAILKASGQTLDLSEENMKNLMQSYSNYGWKGIETNDGGYDLMAIGYLVSWMGPVNEKIENYDDYSMLSPLLNSITHIQNIKFIGRENYTDNDKIKEAIIKYGAVATGIYYDYPYFLSSKNSYYYFGSSNPNHAVAIVGWDDTFSKNNFASKPTCDGAWIVKNSWGSSWGDDGYFYVSYYDTKLAKVGVPDSSYVFVFNDTLRYDKNYQYDILGKTDYFVSGLNTIWVENIFNATDNELLSAVSTYFRKVTDWELFIQVNDKLVLTKNGTCTPGYTTIDLKEYIPITKGDLFKIIFKLSSVNGAEFAISEEVYANKMIYSPGISFFSNDGKNWIDLYDYKFSTNEDGGHSYESQVAAIKAFTILYEIQPTIKLNLSNNYNVANIIATVQDQYNNIIRSGEIIFNIEGVNHIVKIENSQANLTYAFKNIGIYNIIVNYKNTSSNTSINITKINVNISFNIVKNKNNIVINLLSPYNITTDINLILNNKTYHIKLINGVSSLKLNNLDYGYFNVTSIVVNDIYGGIVKSSFNITIRKTKIIADDFIVYYNGKNKYSVNLIDINGNSIANKPVSFVISGKSYISTTNLDGIASIPIKLNKKGNYKINIIFYGDDDYFASNTTSNLKVESTIILENKHTYIINSEYNAKILDQNGNQLSKTQLCIVINGISYWRITNYEGVVSINLNFKQSKYSITIFNPKTGENKTKIINLLPKIVENKNLKMYFGSGASYKVRVHDDNGKFVGVGQVVIFKINGKIYKVKTDKKGYASLKITLKPKSYTITVNYNGVKVSNKIIVKPILMAKNISKKKTKIIIFKANIVNIKGEIVENKKINFKFKGKSYIIKTNKKGVATLKLKNLKVGKYTIITKYCKSTIKNTIKIKK